MTRARRIPIGLAALLACAFAFAAHAAPGTITLGINAGVSTRDSFKVQTEKFAPLAQGASRALRVPISVEPVRSPEVPKAVAAKRIDLLIIHTNAALAAVKKEGYTMLALSRDLKDDRVHFMVRKDGPASVAGCRGKTIWSAGAKSYATETGRAVLRSQGVAGEDFTLKVTKYQDAIPFMLDNEFGDVGMTRVETIAREWERGGGRILYSTDRLPVYALVAKPGGDAALMRRVGEWMVAMSQTPEGEAALAPGGFKGFRATTTAEADALATWFGF